MDAIRINTGEVRVPVIDHNDRKLGELVFNPEDELFAERLYSIFRGYQEKADEFERRRKEILGATELQSGALPENFVDLYPDLNALNKEAWEWTFGEIDSLFGAGTAQMVFQGVLNPNILEQFFDGVSQFFRPARQKKIAKYLPADGNGQPKIKRRKHEPAHG